MSSCKTKNLSNWNHCNVTIGCGSGWLSESEKNIGAGGWRADNLFEAVDSGDA